VENLQKKSTLKKLDLEVVLSLLKSHLQFLNQLEFQCLNNLLKKKSRLHRRYSYKRFQKKSQQLQQRKLVEDLVDLKQASSQAHHQRKNLLLSNNNKSQ
jgi:hypothetical protein